jgi:hypothetical protein
MVAIALRESGGNPDAHNPNPPDDSYGLWQINMLGALGTARLQEFGLATKEQLYDPATNAAAAYRIWGGSDANLSRHWYIDRGMNATRYQQYFPVAEQARASVEESQAPSEPGVPVFAIGTNGKAVMSAEEYPGWVLPALIGMGVLAVWVAVS